MLSYTPDREVASYRLEYPVSDCENDARHYRTGPCRVRAEYLDMPGMRLKPEQVQRLCGIEQKICQMVLASLVDAKFLYATPDGQYARLVDADSTRPRMTDSRNGTRSKKAS